MNLVFAKNSMVFPFGLFLCISHSWINRKPRKRKPEQYWLATTRAFRSMVNAFSLCKELHGISTEIWSFFCVSVCMYSMCVIVTKYSMFVSSRLPPYSSRCACCCWIQAWAKSCCWIRAWASSCPLKDVNCKARPTGLASAMPCGINP